MGSPTTSAGPPGGVMLTLTAFPAGVAAIGVPDEAESVESGSVPLPVPTSGAPAGNGKSEPARSAPSSATHSKRGPVSTPVSPFR